MVISEKEVSSVKARQQELIDNSQLKKVYIRNGKGYTEIYNNGELKRVPTHPKGVILSYIPKDTNKFHIGFSMCCKKDIVNWNKHFATKVAIKRSEKNFYRKFDEYENDLMNKHRDEYLMPEFSDLIIIPYAIMDDLYKFITNAMSYHAIKNMEVEYPHWVETFMDYYTERERN